MQSETRVIASHALTSCINGINCINCINYINRVNVMHAKCQLFITKKGQR